MIRTISARGEWPGRVTLRAGWSQSIARPLNDDVADASLRLERGSASFLRQSAEWLFDQGVPAVLSIPLHPGTRRVWDDAGFEPYRELLLMERDLSFAVEPPAHRITEGGSKAHWKNALEVDNAAFEPGWRIGRLGLEDARAATPTAGFLVHEIDDRVSGFSIVGIAQSTAYLQRIAVDPEYGRQGIGRSLIRATIQWARQRSARSILLNTQLDNHGAARLYARERFEALPQHLVLLRSTPS
ncbi:MAG: GNAT family N-acetyltransferase [Acidimicrobiia bacterium]|nr:GNAT family N-acetyltransferase [Acidimicrobiia bacterium]